MAIFTNAKSQVWAISHFFESTAWRQPIFWESRISVRMSPLFQHRHAGDVDGRPDEELLGRNSSSFYPSVEITISASRATRAGARIGGRDGDTAGRIEKVRVRGSWPSACIRVAGIAASTITGETRRGNRCSGCLARRLPPTVSRHSEFAGWRHVPAASTRRGKFFLQERRFLQSPSDVDRAPTAM